MRKIKTLFVIISMVVFNHKLSGQDNPEKLLLSDFRPVSIYNIPTTYISKARYPVIDMHSHPYPKSNAELELWVETMDATGIDATVIMTYTVGAEFDSLVEVYSKYPNRFIMFCGFDYTGYDQPGYGPDAVEELERCVKMGAKGVGELGDKGKGLFYSKPVKGYGMHIDDKRLEPLLKICADLKIPVAVHVADPKWMYEKMDSTNDGLMNAYSWRLDNQEGIIDHTGMVKTLENAVNNNPETTFIALHYANCSHDLSILGNLLDKYPNLFTGMGARFAETATIPRYMSKFLNKYQDRVVYGTDMGTNSEMYRYTFRILESKDEHFYDANYSYHWPLHGFGLGDKILEKIYRSNALKILKR